MSGLLNSKGALSISDMDPISTLINAKTNLTAVRAEDLVTIKEEMPKNFL